MKTLTLLIEPMFGRAFFVTLIAVINITNVYALPTVVVSPIRCI
jgi:hypothetical protein